MIYVFTCKKSTVIISDDGMNSQFRDSFEEACRHVADGHRFQQKHVQETLLFYQRVRDNYKLVQTFSDLQELKETYPENFI